MNVAAYARYSTSLQTQSSIADQLRACREHAAARGWTVVEEYTDAAISGAAVGNRPQLQRMYADALAGKFSAVLVTDLTRLSPAQGDLAPMLERLRFRGVQVVGVQDGYDSSSRTARMQAGLSGIMSEEFRAGIRERTHLALESRARSSRSTGGKCYGYQLDGSPDPEQSAIVREIFTRAAAGDSLRTIASDLNARGIPSPGSSWDRTTRRRGGWMVSTLHAMVRNERYIGQLVWNRSQWVKDPDTGRRIRRERPRSEWVTRHDPTAQLVDDATWRAVRARQDARTGYGGGAGGGPRYLLSGLLRCASCGAAMIITGGSSRRYVCSTHHHGGPAACGMSLGVARAEAERALLDPVTRYLSSPEVVESAIEAMRRALAEASRPAAPRDLTEADAQLARVEQLIEAGVLTGAVANAARQEALDARRRADASTRATPARLWPTDALRRVYADSLREWRATLAGDDVTAAREALRRLLGDVPLAPSEDGCYLQATVQLETVPMLQVSGEWIGSGGASWNRSPGLVHCSMKAGRQRPARG